MNPLLADRWPPLSAAHRLSPNWTPVLRLMGSSAAFSSSRRTRRTSRSPETGVLWEQEATCWDVRHVQLRRGRPGWLHEQLEQLFTSPDNHREVGSSGGQKFSLHRDLFFSSAQLAARLSCGSSGRIEVLIGWLVPERLWSLFFQQIRN